MSYRREFTKVHPTNKNLYWCDPCQCWVQLDEMKEYYTDEDYVVEKDCPGCDTTLLAIVYDPDDL